MGSGLALFAYTQQIHVNAGDKHVIDGKILIVFHIHQF